MLKIAFREHYTHILTLTRKHIFCICILLFKSQNQIRNVYYSYEFQISVFSNYIKYPKDDFKITCIITSIYSAILNKCKY